MWICLAVKGQEKCCKYNVMLQPPDHAPGLHLRPEVILATPVSSRVRLIVNSIRIAIMYICQK